MKNKKFAYLFFHLNLFFSSLPENKRKQVIEKCYWPLLKLIDKTDFNIGIEITGWTLLEIKKLDQKWINFFKKLLKQKKTYLIGSSFTQAIFPLIPYEVNNYNIKYGKEIYKKILNQTPKVAYVNEQCFSKSVVDLFKNQKYQNLIMDWDCIKNIPNLTEKLRYYPQILKGNKKTIKVIWNSSNNFQNFQKTIHSKLNQSEYLKVFNKANSFKEGVISLYGSDAEIFDFRLRRFENETHILNKNTSEWQKIFILLNIFKNKYSFLNLNEISKINFTSIYFNQLIDITTVNSNLPTKKQRKYNPLRWYVGGLNNYFINTLCWRIYLLSKKNNLTFKKLSYFWSSDFRTHIEKNRFKNLVQQLNNETKNLSKKNQIENIVQLKKKLIPLNNYKYTLDQTESFFNYHDGKYFFKLDKERGLTLNSFGLIKNKTHHSFLKKYNQGDFYNERLNVDFYCGHNVLENSNLKYSDLDKRGVTKLIKKNNFLIFSNNFYIDNIISINKYWYFDIEKKILYLHNKIRLFSIDFLTIRSNFFNINHKIFDLNNLKFSTKNGGSDYEIFTFNKNINFYHDDTISPKFTAQNCFGNTDGSIAFSDHNHKIIFNFFHQVGTSAPMLCFQYDRKKEYFLRFLSSFKENNDVKSYFVNKNYESLISIKLS